MTPYDQASDYILTNLETVCPFLFPQGKREGQNYIVGNIANSPGRSFSIALEPPARRGLYKDFATNSAASRNLPQLWKDAHGIPKDNHARFFQDLGAFAGQDFGWNGATTKAKGFDWPKRLREFTPADAQRLATHPKRQWQVDTLLWLHAHEYLGLYRGHVTFAMRDEAGNVVGINRWFESEAKWKFINSPTLLVIGDPGNATELHIHESINDLVAMLDQTDWHLDATKLFFCTWGVPGAKLVKDRIPVQINKIYVWEQRDQPDPKTGKKPNEVWQTGVARAAGRPIRLVRIPEAYKDLNEWTIAGASAVQIEFACDLATLYQGSAQHAQPPPVSYQNLPQNFPPADERPCYRVYDTPITINQREFKAGVYHHEVKTFGDKDYPQDSWLCAHLLILARTATTRDRDFGRLLEYHSSNGILRRWSMPMELLAGDGAEVLSRLLRDGLDVNIPIKKKVLDYIAAAQSTEFYRCATRTGWHSPIVFVQTEAIIATADTKEKVWFQSTSRTADYAQGDTPEAWQR